MIYHFSVRMMPTTSNLFAIKLGSDPIKKGIIIPAAAVVSVVPPPLSFSLFDIVACNP